MTNFKKALGKRKAAEVALIQKKIIDWENISIQQKKIVSNLYKEHFSPVVEMEKFINDLLGFITEPAKEFHKRVLQTYNQYVFTGSVATVNISVTKLGFSLTRYTLNSVIERDYYDYFAQEPNEVESFLNLKSVGSKDPLLDHLVIKGVGSTIWVTWSETSNDPFDFVKQNRREEVYNALALSQHYVDGPIFLFRTNKESIESKSILIRPTVFDAGNYSPFLPVNVSFKRHGFTDPYNDSIMSIEGIPLVNDKRPEIIIDGSDITWSDIEQIKEL